MKRFLCLILTAQLLCIVLAGCSGGTTEQTPPAPEETNVNLFYTIQDDKKDDLCAVLFLGADEAQIEERFAQLQAAYDLPLSLTDQDIVGFDAGGDERYLILPKHRGTVVTLAAVELEDGGDLTPAGGQMTTALPVLLRCNPSDIMPSALVTVKAEEQTITFSPYISLKDGSVAAIESVYTA